MIKRLTIHSLSVLAIVALVTTSFFINPVPAYAAVAYGHASSGTALVDTSLSFSHDATGDDLLLVTCSFRDVNVSNVAITYDGVNMDAKATATAGVLIYTHAFELASPSSGSNTVAVSWTTNSGGVTCTAISVSGSDGTTGTADTGNAAASTDNFSTTVTLADGDMLVGFGSGLGTVSALAVVTGTQRVEAADAGGNVTVNGLTNTGTGSVSGTWSRAAADVATWVGIPVNGVSAPLADDTRIVLYVKDITLYVRNTTLYIRN